MEKGKISVGNLLIFGREKIHFLSKVLKEDWSPPKWQNGLGSGNPVNDKAMYEYIKKNIKI